MTANRLGYKRSGILSSHVTLVMAAYAVLAVTAARAKAAHPAPVLPHDPDQPPPTDCGMIALTVPELQRLLRILLPGHQPKDLDVDAQLAWSLWRRGTAVQDRSPAAIRGRVIAVASLAGSMPQLLGQAIGAALVAVLPYLTLCSIVASVIGTCAASLAVSTMSLGRGKAPRPVSASFEA